VSEKNRVRQAVASALDADVDVREGSDGTWHLAVSGTRRQPRFRTLWLRRGWPADVRTAVERFPQATLVVAPALSSGARTLLEDQQVNWVDETGAASVRGDGLLVRIDRGSAPTDPKPARSQWSPASVLAAEAMLVLQPSQISTGWLAKHAGCSVPRASGILQRFDEEGWTVKRGPLRGRGAHRTLEQPGALLTSFADYINNRPLERWFAHSTTRDLDALQRRLAETLSPFTYAWTGWAAAEHLAPFVSQLPVLHLRISDEYLRRELEPVLSDAGITLTQDAGRIELWRTPAQELRHVTPSPEGPLLAWPRVYADLQRLGGRGLDAAEHLRETVTTQT
jgi:hypothetical protein